MRNSYYASGRSEKQLRDEIALDRQCKALAAFVVAGLLLALGVGCRYGLLIPWAVVLGTVFVGLGALARISLNSEIMDLEDELEKRADETLRREGVR